MHDIQYSVVGMNVLQRYKKDCIKYVLGNIYI